MSMHKIPPTNLERFGLQNHRLPIGTPSQLSDCFRSGMKWALDNASPQFKPFSDKPEYEKPLLISVRGKAKYSAYMLCVTDGCDEWLEEINGIGPDIVDLDTVDGWMYWPEPASPEVK